MRLIDADKLAKILKGNSFDYANSDEKDSLIKADLLNEIAEIIECEELTPTDFDTDKVIEELKKCKKDIEILWEMNIDNYNSYDSMISDCCRGGYDAIVDAIRIVKGGGLNGRTDSI